MSASLFPFFVTGLGHSGTGWAAKLLSRLGAPCAHEEHATHEGFELPDQGESSWLAVGWLEEIPPTVPILHLVREPLAVLRSIYRSDFLGAGLASDTPHAAFARSRCPELESYPGGLERQVAWVARWGAPLEARSGVLRLRIEDASPELLNGALRFVGARRRSAADIAEALEALGTETNAHDREADDSAVSWERVAECAAGPAFLARAERLGYGPQ